MERYALQDRMQAHCQLAQLIIARQYLRAYIHGHHVLSHVFRPRAHQSAIANNDEIRPEIIYEHLQQEERMPAHNQYDALEQMIPVSFPSLPPQQVTTTEGIYVSPVEAFTSQEEIASLPDIDIGKPEELRSVYSAALQDSQATTSPVETRSDSIGTSSERETRSEPVHDAGRENEKALVHDASIIDEPFVEDFLRAPQAKVNLDEPSAKSSIHESLEIASIERNNDRPPYKVTSIPQHKQLPNTARSIKEVLSHKERVVIEPSEDRQAQITDTTHQAVQTDIETISLDDIARESAETATAQDEQRQSAASNSEQPPAAKARRRPRRSLIEEHPAIEKRQNGSTRQTPATSLASSGSQKLTPQETKAAVDALFQPKDDIPALPAQWQQILQSQWGNKRKSVATPQKYALPEHGREPHSADTHPQAYIKPENSKTPYYKVAHPQAYIEPENSKASYYKASHPQRHTVTQTHVLAQEQDPKTGEMSQPGAAPFIAPLQSTPVGSSPAQRLRYEWEEAQVPVQNAAMAALEGQSAEPLSQRARQFLRPLVGFDSVNVDIYRGAPATRLVDAYQADAITVGQQVIIGGKHSGEETPEALGLLAHELTHVARQHLSGHVPPVVGSANQQDKTYLAPLPASAAFGQMLPTLAANGVSSPLPTSRSEEQLAQEVEQQVIEYAQEGARQGNAASADSNGARKHPGYQAEAANTSIDSMEWGNLPAPWEPLPAWFLTTPAQAPRGTTVERWSNVSERAPTSPGPFVGKSVEINNGEVQRAATERSARPTKQPDAEEDEQRQPEVAPSVMPDIDVLAQQVYQLLKRRFDVERRRMK